MKKNTSFVQVLEEIFARLPKQAIVASWRRTRTIKPVHWFLLVHKSYRSRLTPIVSTVGQVAQHCLLTTKDEKENKQTNTKHKKNQKTLSVPELFHQAINNNNIAHSETTDFRSYMYIIKEQNTAYQNDIM